MDWTCITCLLLTVIVSSTAQPEPSIALILDGVDVAVVENVRRSYEDNNITSVHVIDITGYSPFQLFNTACTLASSGTVAMVTQASCEAILTLSSAADNLGMTLIAEGSDCDAMAIEQVMVATDAEEYVTESETVLIKTRNTPFVDGVLYDVLLLLGWEDTIVLYEEANDIANYVRNLDYVMDAVNGTSQIFTVAEGSMSDNIGEMLNYMESSRSHHHVLVICGLNCTNQLLYRANQLDQSGVQQALFTYAVQWLVLTEMESLPMVVANVGEMDHVTVMTPPKQRDVDLAVVENLMNVVNVTMEGVRSVLDWEWHSAVTQCGTKLQSGHNLARELEPLLGEVITPDESPFEIYAAIWKPGRTHAFELVAEWGSDTILLHDTIFPNVKRGLNGKFLKIGTNIWDPFVIHDANSTIGYKGYCMDLLAMMATQFNFSFVLLEPADGQWGVFDNGTYTGLVGQLVDREVDMVVAPLGQGIQRSQYIDFTIPFFIETQTVLVKYPDPSKSNWRIYLDPFQWDVWTGILIAIPVAAIILWAFHRLSPYYPKEERRKGMGDIQDSFWYSFGSFLTQGSDIVPDAQSARFVVGFWLMYCLVVIASYSGNLVAFFTVSNPSVPFNSLNEMVNSSYKFGTMAGTYNYGYIMTSRSGIFRTIGDNILEFAEVDPDVASYDHDVHVKKVQHENYAYIVDTTAASLLTNVLCTLDSIREEFIPLKYSVALQNNSAYKESFDRGLESFTENGLSLRWKQNWWPQISECDRGLVTSSKPVSLSDMQGAFFLLAIVLALAMVCLFIELSVWGVKRHKDSNLRELEQQKQQTEPHREVRFYQYDQDFGRFE